MEEEGIKNVYLKPEETTALLHARLLFQTFGIGVFNNFY